jgi:hypothetical protein
MLHPASHAPQALPPCERLLHHVVQATAPQGPAPAAARVVARHQPPTGIQLWPGHHLLLRLRLPWPFAERVLVRHWPQAEWPLYLRHWQLQPCARHHAHWTPEPHWVPAAPHQYKPLAAQYHPASGHAEWTFLLTEPCALATLRNRPTGL